ncbi:hypothetical protein, partial [Umezakia ovalisporum]|uniref:hypothetical protein n=1 Tax=Umezakia ovalisporum TaxID=75695 RepID=UPI0039C604C0
MKKHILFYFLITICTSLFAQNNPGYLGKKTYIGLSAAYCPNIAIARNMESNINYNNKPTNYFITPLVYSIGIGRAINYKWTIGLDYEFQRYGVLTQEGIPMNWEDGYYSKNTGEYAYARAVANSFRLKFVYATDIPAPMGAYSTFGVLFQTNKVSAVRGEGNGYAFSNPGGVEDFGTHADFGFFFGGGVKREIYKSLIIDLGVDFNYYLGRFILGAPYYESNEITPSTYKDYLHQSSAQKNHLNSL